MADKTHYEALQVAPDASADDIKRAYRKMARKYHPDITPGPKAEATFKAASAAYDVLRDPEKRAAYDRYGADWDQPRPEPKPQSGRQSGRQSGPQWDGGFAFDERDVDSQMFRDFFGQRQGARSMEPDQHARIEISLEDSIEGRSLPLSLQMPQLDRSGHATMTRRDINLRIPKGAMPGQHLRLQGQGAQGGDLFVEIAFKPHPIYTIEGRDLYVVLPVLPWEAALGGKVKMPTPTGPVDLTIPQNARQDQKLRLRGRGLPGSPKGDLYAVLKIVNPPTMSKKARDLYQSLASEHGFNPRSKLGV
ncbi:MAG: DnaJ domain-containing protein [Yoonia sp.]|nr:DnaJ domain-containing protein [Yoonia sp.]